MFTISIPIVLCGTRSFALNFPSLDRKTKFGNYNTCLVRETRSKRRPFYTSSWSELDQYCLNKKAIAWRSRHRSLLLVSCAATSSESGDEEDNNKEALLTVLKLYTAIKNRNIRELSDIVCEECFCVCNFFSIFQPLRGKQQVLELFKYVIKILGNNIEFIVHPTFSDGMNVGVSWRLEWKKTNVTLGKGFSFHICHQYHGKVLIRNVEMFMEPLLHIEPIRLKIMGVVSSITEKMMRFLKFSKGRMRKLLFAVFFMAIILPITIWICAKSSAF